MRKFLAWCRESIRPLKTNVENCLPKENLTSSGRSMTLASSCEKKATNVTFDFLCRDGIIYDETVSFGIIRYHS